MIQMLTQTDVWLSVGEAAAELGVTTGRIRQKLRAGELRGKKFGWAWAISAEEINRHRQEKHKNSVSRR